MPTPRWDLFAAVVVLAVLALVSLSAASARAITGAGRAADEAEGERDDYAADEPGGEGDSSGELPVDSVPSRPTPPVPTGGALLANVAMTHGLLGVTVIALAWIARVPPSALGLGDLAGSVVVVDAALGAILGVGLYLASEAGTALADRTGIAYDERLRDLLAPESPAGWALLLLGILPIVAAAEELLFRAALIGALGAGFGVPAWALVVASSVLFGAGHGAQGAIGIAVTAILGLVLGAAFVLTGSLVVVVVAHYLVNVLEFVVREGILDRPPGD